MVQNIESLQGDTKTYSEAPEDKEFLEWQKSFVWQDHKDDIQQILGKNPTILNLYQELGKSK